MQGEIGKNSEEKQGRNGNTKEPDVEAGKVTATAGGALYPNMAENPKLRWAFIRKVYLILAVQFLITAVMATTFNLVRPISGFITGHSHASIAFTVVSFIFPFIALIPMLYFRKRHPVNMVFLVLFTLSIGLLVSEMSSILKRMYLLEAACITTIVLFGLSLYTFWAARRGHDFKFLAPFLFVATLVLIFYLTMQLLLPFNRASTSLYGSVATIIYSGMIIYDTDNLIKRHKYDEYTTAAVSLYLDVINLFMGILGISAFKL